MKTLNKYIALLLFLLVTSSVSAQYLHMYKGSEYKKGYLTTSIDSLCFGNNGSYTNVYLYNNGVKFNAGALGVIDSMSIGTAYDSTTNKVLPDIYNLDLVAYLNSIPRQLSQGYLIYGTQTHEADMSYPAYMIIQTQLLGDMYPGFEEYTGYDWYMTYNVTSRNFGDNSYPAYLAWETFYRYISKANAILATVNQVDTPSDYTNAVAAVARVYRAFAYYMLTVLYEPKENIYTDCSQVLGLTVPIVTENTTEEEAANNPRATHDEMIEFILNDLTLAEDGLSNYDFNDLRIPNLAVVYGLRAKVYMWDEDYKNAAEYARRAIDMSDAEPMEEHHWTDETGSLSTIAENMKAWMWYTSYESDYMGNLCNFTGWMSPEAQWGYASLTAPVIDKSLYDAIAYSDFRKKVFVDPDRVNNPRATVREDGWLDGMPDYTALKFRCKSGSTSDYRIGGSIDLPIMRVEEMFLIEAEAVGASRGLSEGVALLNDFMTRYRQSDYQFKTESLRQLQFEVLKQMRIEFWGEGTAFQSAKRLQFGVVQNYKETNAPSDEYRINCKGIKPTWNFVIPISAMEDNVALVNNPDPTNTVEWPSMIEDPIYDWGCWSEWKQVGTCTYNLAGYWSGSHSKLRLYYREYLLNDTDAQFYIEGVAYKMNITINYNRQTGECQVPVQQATTHDSYGPVFVSDIPNYPLEPGLSYEDYPCTYDAEKGRFSLYLIYFASEELGSSATGYFALGVETIQRDGFLEEDEFVGAPIEDYVGEWSFVSTWPGDESYEWTGKIEQTEVQGQPALLCTGFAGPLAEQLGYTDDAFIMLYDAESGLVTLPAQDLAPINYQGADYDMVLMLANTAEMQVFDGSLIGGFKGGKFVFVNAESNEYTADSWIFYARDLGGLSNFNALEMTRVGGGNDNGEEGEIEGAEIEAYEGDWAFSSSFPGREPYKWTGNIQRVEIEGEIYLLCTGFGGPTAQQLGYDDSFLMNYDEETGLIGLPAQEMADLEYQGSTYPCALYPGISETGQVFPGNLVGGFNDGKIVLVNDEANEKVADSYVIFAVMNNQATVISYFNSLVLSSELVEAPAKVSAFSVAERRVSILSASKAKAQFTFKSGLKVVEKSIKVNNNELKQF